MRKIVLFCSGGMSTSVLMKNIQKEALNIDYEVSVEAFGIIDIKKNGEDTDIILLAPQIRYMLDSVLKKLPNKKIMVISMHDYGRINGLAIINEVKKILND